MVVGWVSDIIEHEATGADIRGALQQSMDNNAAVFRTEETLKQAAHHPRAQNYSRITVHDKRVQHRPCEISS